MYHNDKSQDASLDHYFTNSISQGYNLQLYTMDDYYHTCTQECNMYSHNA